jgi:hypothetical protein
MQVELPQASWPGLLSRPSTSYIFELQKDVDARDRRGHEDDA